MLVYIVNSTVLVKMYNIGINVSYYIMLYSLFGTVLFRYLDLMHAHILLQFLVYLKMVFWTKYLLIKRLKNVKKTS